MSTRIEFYERLREHIPEEAARLIAEEMPAESQLATKNDMLLVMNEFRDELRSTERALHDEIHGVSISVERLRSSMFRWQLTFFIPLWAGVYGTLVAIILRGP